MTDEIALEVIGAYEGLGSATVERFGGGLINDTFLVRARQARFVLQRVSPIFPAAIHHNIAAVTARLTAAGLVTQELVRTKSGALFQDRGPDGVWRVMTFVEGACHDVVGSAAQARAAGELVAHFHRAVDGLSHAFVGMRLGVHDTPKHLARLREAVATHGGHRLAAPVATLAAEILAGADQMPPLPSLPERICHGDVKFNNVLFAGDDPGKAVCLIDLDTVGPMSLAFELGDAWRSWCNRSGEDEPEAQLDLEVLRAALDGYRQGLGRDLTAEEIGALLHGVEWVSLELAARFAADALNESYFRWNPARFTGKGEHNLVRARGQWSLHRALLMTRTQRQNFFASETVQKQR